jgi:hypothetical protein
LIYIVVHLDDSLRIFRICIYTDQIFWGEPEVPPHFPLLSLDLNERDGKRERGRGWEGRRGEERGGEGRRGGGDMGGNLGFPHKI